MIVIVGESGCGKSSLVKEFIKKNNKYHKIITYTTRPMRDNETDAIDYHFVTEERFKTLLEQDFFIESNAYRNWLYGTAMNDCVNDEYAIAVLTPAGLRALLRNKVKVTSIYLYVDRRTRLISILNRGDDIEEAYRRNVSDVGQFDGIIDEVDYVIDNNKFRMDIDNTIRCLEAIIKDREEKVTANGN